MSGSYLVRRVLLAIPALLAISLILYTVLALAPGDPLGATGTKLMAALVHALRARGVASGWKGGPRQAGRSPFTVTRLP